MKNKSIEKSKLAEASQPQQHFSRGRKKKISVIIRIYLHANLREEVELFLWASLARPFAWLSKDSREGEKSRGGRQSALRLLSRSRFSDRCRIFFSVAEPKKEKAEQSANGAISPSGGEPPTGNLGPTGPGAPASGPVPDSGEGQQKPNRPNTLDARVVARRLILFDSE